MCERIKDPVKSMASAFFPTVGRTGKAPTDTGIGLGAHWPVLAPPYSFAQNDHKRGQVFRVLEAFPVHDRGHWYAFSPKERTHTHIHTYTDAAFRLQHLAWFMHPAISIIC